MTQSFEQLLYLFGAASLGKDVIVENEINIEDIRKYAVDQRIWTVIFKKLECLCDVSKYENEFFSIIVESARRAEYTSLIISKLEESGVECCLLKGETVARLYHNPECRVSGDTDILIKPGDEQKSIKILSENGYSIERRTQNGHHFKARHPIGGLIEVHVKLYSHVTEEVIFNGLNFYEEPFHEIHINGKEYKTLGINDGLMYLTAHYIKHLINSGGGIRQMMDLLLYIEHYKDKINFEKYHAILKQLRYEKLIKTVMSIGAKYFGFDYDIIEEDLMTALLNDTEKGGIFGFSADDRNGFYSDYCKSRAQISDIEYSKKYLRRSEGFSLMRTLFPAKKNMLKLGYDDKILLVSWIKRLYGILTKRRPRKAESKKSGIDERMNLMKNLDMIE